MSKNIFLNIYLCNQTKHKINNILSSKEMLVFSILIKDNLILSFFYLTSYNDSLFFKDLLIQDKKITYI